MNGRDKFPTIVLALGLAASSIFVLQNAASASAPGSGFPVTIVAGHNVQNVQSSAEDVGALLEEHGITLGKNDEVFPSLADMLIPHETIRIVRVTRWIQTEHERVAPQTIHRYVFSLSTGHTSVLAHGHSGLRETLVRYEQRDNGPVIRYVIGSHMLRKPRPRIVALGTSEYAAFTQLAQRGLDKTAYIAGHAMHMVATAYTAECGGCSGWTATGQRAGHGIVAVDPHVIPLGAHLYIPGYGLAIAGDTGGAIHGNRIDLGFNSNWDALQFGRRSIVVYRLK